MKRVALLALVLAFGISCDDSPTSPSDPNVAKFTAILLPSNEVPAITNADAAASGTMQLTMTVTRDAASDDHRRDLRFPVNFTGFPANTTLTGAHIHNAPAGTNAGVVVGLPLTASDTAVPRARDRSPRPTCRARPRPSRRRPLRRGSSTTRPATISTCTRR